MHYPSQLLSLLVFSLVPFHFLGQNTSPELSIVSTSVDTSAHTITITYNVHDAENDPLEIRAFLSVDSGHTHITPGSALSGDVGFPITPGNGKTLVVNYNPDSLAAYASSPSAWSTVKLVATDQKSPNIADIIAQIDSERVLQDMAFLAQPRHHIAAPAGLSAIKDSIEHQFFSKGLQTKRLPFTMGGVPSENILGRKPGLLQESEVIIIDGHFDAVANTNAADDNATAIAAVLATLRAFQGYAFEKTINFLAFDKEEFGLVGAADYVANRIEPYENIEAVINGEMLGYYDTTANSQAIPTGFSMVFPSAVDSIANEDYRGIFLFVVGNTQNSAWLSALFDSVARQHVSGVRSVILDAPGVGTLTPDLRRSDHAVFWDAGISALMITDGADTRNPHYHQASDTTGTLNIPYLVRNIKAMAATVAVLAQPIYADEASTDGFQLLLKVPNAIEKKDPLAQFEVFPNPTQEQVQLRFPKNIEEAQVFITDPNGKLVLQTTISARAGETVTLRLTEQGASSLEEGMYIVDIQHADNRYSRKLIIHHGHSH